MIKKNNITLNKIDSKIITKIEDVKIVKFCEIISIFFIFKMTFWYCHLLILSLTISQFKSFASSFKVIPIKFSGYLISYSKITLSFFLKSKTSGYTQTTKEPEPS